MPERRFNVDCYRGVGIYLLQKIDTVQVAIYMGNRNGSVIGFNIGNRRHMTKIK